MNNTNQFDWVNFYKEFASTLLQYKNNREILVEKVEKIYELTGIDMPTLELLIIELSLFLQLQAYLI